MTTTHETNPLVRELEAQAKWCKAQGLPIAAALSRDAAAEIERLRAQVAVMPELVDALEAAAADNCQCPKSGGLPCGTCIARAALAKVREAAK